MDQYSDSLSRTGKARLQKLGENFEVVILSGASPFAREWAGGVEGPLPFKMLAQSRQKIAAAQTEAKKIHRRKGAAIFRI
jgi:hypothetical protein